MNRNPAPEVERRQPQINLAYFRRRRKKGITPQSEKQGTAGLRGRCGGVSLEINLRRSHSSLPSERDVEPMRQKVDEAVLASRNLGLFPEPTFSLHRSHSSAYSQGDRI